MTNLHRSYYAAAFGVATLAFAGCGGQASSPSAIPFPNGTESQPQVQGNVPCEHSSLQVTPCRVSFSTNNPSPKIVRVITGDGDQQIVHEKDDCVRLKIATIARDGIHHRYIVAAGAARGWCTVRFATDAPPNDGGQAGSPLIVENRL